MKKIPLLFLLMLPVWSIAQSNYKSGYVVTLKGDTLHGYINYKEWGRNPKNISFKPTPADKARQFGLSGINYFEINGLVSYRAYRVAVSLNQVDLASLSSAVDTASEIDTVFLKILQKGRNITLYAYKDKLKERFYIKDKTMDVPAELLYGVHQDIKSDQPIYNNTFRGQLSEMVVKYTPGTDQLIAQVQQLRFTEDDLVSIAAQINGDSRAKASLKSGNSSPFRFFAGAAFISSTLKAGQYYGSPTFTSGSAKIAVGVDAIVNPSVGHLVFRLELAYAVNNYNILDDLSDPTFNIAQPETSSIKVQQNVIFITPQVIYNIYNADSFKVFADIGFSYSLLSYARNQVTSYQYGHVIAPEPTEALNSFGSYFAFQCKAGVVLSKRFEIYGAWFPGANLANSDAYTSILTSYQVGVNYFFGEASH